MGYAAVSVPPHVKYGVRSPKFIWAPCVQLYSLAVLKKSKKVPLLLIGWGTATLLPPAIGLIHGATTSLCDPLCLTPLYCHNPLAKLPQQLFSSSLYVFFFYGCTRLISQLFPGKWNDDFHPRRSPVPPDFVVMRALLVLSSTSSTMEKVKPVGFGSSLSVGGGGVT